MTELDQLVIDKINGKTVAEPVERKVTDSFKRGVLSEGRNYGLGFSILDKTEDEYKALMAFTACKDYLNDFMYIEGTSNPLSSIYGFSHKYTGILKDKDYFYLGLRSLHYNNGSSKYPLFDSVSSLLKNNHKNIIEFLNKLEKELKVEKLSEFESYIDDILIIKVPIFWSKFSFLFSMYGLLVRCFLDINAEDLKKDILKIVTDKKVTIIPDDGSLLRSIQQRPIFLDVDKLLDYKYPSPTNSSHIHNFGIVTRMNQISVKK